MATRYKIVLDTQEMTLTNKKLTAPKFDNGGYIADASGDEILKFLTASPAANYWYMTSAGTGFPPILTVDGSDTNVGMQFQPKGSGVLQILDGADYSKGVYFTTSAGTTSTSTNLTFSQTSNRTITFPDATDTLVGKATTDTLTNKRVTKRTGTTTSSATPTINTDNVDFYSITALATAITSFTTNLSGTPTIGQVLWIAITDNGTARAITWGASFEASTVALPTTTVISTRLDVGFVWNSVTSKWRCVAVA